MKKIASISTLIATLAFAPVSFADAGGTCHFHGNAAIKEDILVGCATKYKDGLASKRKIDTSWTVVKLDKAETVDGKKMKEWKFTFKNPAEKDASKQTLYLFYTLSGHFIAANFTGK